MTTLISYLLFISIASALTTLWLGDEDTDSDYSKCFIGSVCFYSIICAVVEMISFVVNLLAMTFFDTLPSIGISIIVSMFVCLVLFFVKLANTK